MKKYFSSAALIGLCLGANAQGLVNTGATLKIESGVTLNVDDNLANVSGTIDNQGTVQVSGHFSNTGNPVLNSLFVLDGGVDQDVTGNSQFYDVLQVNKSGGTATVASGTTKIHGHLQLAEGTMDASGNLVIASTATETGLVDDFSDPGFIGELIGELRVQRLIPAGDGFHYIGSAVNTPNLSSQLSELNLYGPNGGQVLPVPTCDPQYIDATSPYGNLFEWRENASFLFNCAQSGWFVRSSGFMTNGRGYAARKGPYAFLMEIGGEEGNTSHPLHSPIITYSGLTSTPSNPSSAVGFHLVSNPFPSPMIWDATNAAVAVSNGFQPTVYFWATSGWFAGQYEPFNPLIPGQGSKGIASQQGFMVESSGGGPHNFTFPQSFRALGDPPFYKEDLTNTFDIIVQAGGFADKTRVRFGDTEETNGYDILDARKIPSPYAQPTLRTRMRDVHYSINSMPLEGHPMTVPMDLIPGISGEFKFTAKYLDQFTVEAHVYLEDLKKNVIQELTVNPVYTFAADESDDPERFLLHFRLNGEEPMYTGDDVMMYAYDKSAFLFLPELEGRAQLEVFSAIGELVYFTNDLYEGKNQINLENLATGTYILRAMVNEQPITKKVVL